MGVESETVDLVASRPSHWAQRFDALHKELRAILGSTVEIEHIGSTAVPDLPAKDVIDVLVGVQDDDSVQSTSALLLDHGFLQEGQRHGHAWLTRKHEARRICVIHVVGFQGSRWQDRIAFRDLLRTSELARAEYLQVKRVAAALSQTWADYTAAKYRTVERLLGAERGRTLD